jgi:hypothetical protein
MQWSHSEPSLQARCVDNADGLARHVDRRAMLQHCQLPTLRPESSAQADLLPQSPQITVESHPD